MMMHRLCSCILGFTLICMAAATPLMASEKRSYPEALKNLPPLTATQNGEIRIIHLTDVLDFFNKTCPGTILSFVAIRYGIDTLFGEDTPDLDDIVVMSRIGGGPLDTLDFILKGGNPANRTWPPPGIDRSMENYVLQFYRKSTLQGVTVSLKRDVWAGADSYCSSAAPTEETTQQRRTDLRSYIFQTLPLVHPSEAFETTAVYTFIPWGSMTEPEMRRNIRNQRRQHAETQEG
ncbi:hypothetical protein LZ24_00331 [Desulfobotulus alkaliphilus]|uniref:Uncharacterized protein n=1 Tax=Desulfobotulus alkaliphilus TaxID=622671 RepID=A0A562S8F2_9BACT|nr:hypothetical protein [Desulfobotulus alkaliphilus]TWI76710.1 hypothetical protein LZ24_00331 [Desulfobotulus alkaliphilus]